MSGNSDPERWNNWIELLAALGAGGLAVLRYGRHCICWLRRLGRSVVLSDRLHAHYGTDPADAVKAIIDATSQSVSIAEIERHLLAERIQIGFYVCDSNGACISANDFLCEMFQTDSKDMLGTGWLINVVDREQVHSKWMTAVKNALPYDSSYQVRLGGGATRTAHTRAYAIVTRSNVVLCYVGYVEWVD